MCKSSWRTEPVNVEKFSDELWIGVKGQSNLVIAGPLAKGIYPRLSAKVPKYMLSGKGCGKTPTTRRLA